MACVKPDGSLTETAKILLRQLDNPLTAEEIASRINQPFFKVRSVMRELVGNGLALETDGKISDYFERERKAVVFKKRHGTIEINELRPDVRTCGTSNQTRPVALPKGWGPSPYCGLVFREAEKTSQ